MIHTEIRAVLDDGRRCHWQGGWRGEAGKDGKELERLSWQTPEGTQEGIAERADIDTQI